MKRVKRAKTKRTKAKAARTRGVVAARAGAGGKSAAGASGAESKEMVVTKIRDGTVIDHIPFGRSLKILKILGVSEKNPAKIALMIGVESRHLGKKDLLKIEGVELDDRTLGKIAVVAPTATINIIKDYKVARKTKATIPEELSSVMRCLNPVCITNREHIGTRFIVEAKNPLRVRCHYCERVFEEDVIPEAL